MLFTIGHIIDRVDYDPPPRGNLNKKVGSNLGINLNAQSVCDDKEMIANNKYIDW